MSVRWRYGRSRIGRRTSPRHYQRCLLCSLVLPVVSDPKTSNTPDPEKATQGGDVSLYYGYRNWFTITIWVISSMQKFHSITIASLLAVLSTMAADAQTSDAFSTPKGQSGFTSNVQPGFTSNVQQPMVAPGQMNPASPGQPNQGAPGPMQSKPGQGTPGRSLIKMPMGSHITGKPRQPVIQQNKNVPSANQQAQVKPAPPVKAGNGMVLHVVSGGPTRPGANRVQSANTLPNRLPPGAVLRTSGPSGSTRSGALHVEMPSTLQNRLPPARGRNKTSSAAHTNSAPAMQYVENYGQPKKRQY